MDSPTKIQIKINEFTQHHIGRNEVFEEAHNAIYYEVMKIQSMQDYAKRLLSKCVIFLINKELITELHEYIVQELISYRYRKFNNIPFKQ